MATRVGFRLFLAASCFLCLASTNALAQGQKITPDSREASADERDNPQERTRWFLRGRTVNGKPAPELLHKAYQQKMNRRAAELKARAAQAQTANTSSTISATPAMGGVQINTPILNTTGPSWTPLGPAPSGTASPGDVNQDYGPAVGRTTVVVVDQSDTTGNTVYIGGAAGGLWKSTNAADPTNAIPNCSAISYSSAPYCAANVTWTPLIDQQPTLTVGAMAIKPDNNQWLVVGTGEANNSADSYYGLGFLVSQNGGATWTLVSSAKSADGTSTIDLHGLGVTRVAFSTDNTNLVVATMAGASQGIAIGAEFAGGNARGIYFSTDAGLHWQRANISDPRGTIQPGSANTVVYNAANKTFYADIRWHGIYSSTDGQNWALLAHQPDNSSGTLNIYNNCPVTPLTNGGSCPIYRSVLTVVPGRAGSSGKGEMYIWIVDVNDGDKGIYQTLDGGATWTALSTTGIDNCGDGSNGSCGTTQGTYNLTLLGVPNGTGTDVWAGAVNQYRCTLSSPTTPSSCSFANLTHTYFSCSGFTDTSFGGFAHVHPDQHGIDFLHTNGDLVYFGNDGGVYRALKSQSGTQSKICTGPTAQPWIQFDNLSGTMGSMLQYVWFSQNPSDSTTLIGGTQDNGSMAKGSSSPASPFGFGYSWQTINNGDGGFNDINPTNPKEWFTSTPQGNGHVDIEQCIKTSGTCTTNDFTQIVSQSTLGGDTAPFYLPYLLDPQAANHLIAGTCRLWRVDRGANATSWPSAAALTYNLDNFATAGTFACSSTAANQVSAIAAGGPCNGTCNPGAIPGLATGNGSQVIYVGTDAGKIFVTTNADGGTSTWNDRSSGLNNTTGCSGTGCPISGIAVDPADPTGNTAYATVMGFKTGHVFKTTNAGASWTNIDGSASGTGLPDNPADAVAIDPNTAGLVYVATDVGVFSSHGDGSWTEVGLSNGAGALPDVATTALKIFGTGANTKLRVSTYGRGIWETSIAPVPTFTIQLTQPPPTIVGQTATLTGTITLIKGYNYPIQVSCGNLDPSLTCTPAQQTLTAGTTSFTIAVSGNTPSPTPYSFNVVAVGGDPQAITQQQPVNFTVQPAPDFTLTAPPQITTVAGTTGSANFGVGANVTFNGTVTFSCTVPTLPTLGVCSIAPNPVVLAANGAASPQFSITPSKAIAPGDYNVGIGASSGSISHSVNAAVHVLEFPDFGFVLPLPAPATTPAGLTGSTTFTIGANTTFNSQYSNNGAVVLSCNSSSVANSVCMLECDTASIPAGAVCTWDSTNQQLLVTLSPSQQQTITARVLTNVNTTPSTYQVGISAAAQTGGSTKAPLQFSLTVQPPTNSFELSGQLQFPNPNVKAGATLTGATVSLRSSAYSGTVSLSCSVPTACTVNPGSASLKGGDSVPISLSLNSFGLPPGNASVIVTAKDATTTVATQPFTYNVQDYSVTSTAPSAILPGGSATSTLSLTPLSGYAGTINATCVVQGTPLTCLLSPIGPYAVSGTTSVTATITGPGTSDTTASGNYTVTVQTSDAGFATLAHNATIPITVQDYKLTTTDSTGAAKTAATVTAGQSASFLLNVVAQSGGFTGSVTLAPATLCSGLPSKTTCTLNGSTSAVTLVAGGSATLAITTTAATTASTRPLPNPGAPLFAFWTMLPGAFGIVVVASRKKSKGAQGKPAFGLPEVFLLSLALVLIVTLTACGGGGGGSTTTPPPVPVPGTPAGTYTITVSSTAGSGSATMTRSTQVTLTVQ